MKWNRMAYKMMIWQVVEEWIIVLTPTPPIKYVVGVKLISAGLNGPEVNDQLAMRDPNNMERNGHLFVVRFVKQLPHYYWQCTLELMPRPGFDDLPGHITPLAFNMKLQPEQQ